MQSNILAVVLILIQVLVCLQRANGLKCLRCNDTEIYTKKCVMDSSYEIECGPGEECTYGRTEKGNSS